MDKSGLVVAKVLEDRNCEETAEYFRLRATLGLGPRFRSPGAGWEKGHVEARIAGERAEPAMPVFEAEAERQRAGIARDEEERTIRPLAATA